MSTHEPVPQRIGDAERDRATSLLTDHLVAGRLSQAEFDDRMSVALNARTADELTPLFTDLPGPSTEVPAEAGQNVANPSEQPRNRALMIASGIAWPIVLMVCFAIGWEYWWLIFIPIALSSLAGKGWPGLGHGFGHGRDQQRRGELGR